LKIHCSSFHTIYLIVSMWPPRHLLVPLNSWHWQENLFHYSSNNALQYDLIQNNTNI
jgi:hypothetical protein